MKLESKKGLQKDIYLFSRKIEVLLWHSRIGIQYCHYSGLGCCCDWSSITGLRMSTCLGCGQKKKKKEKNIYKWITYSSNQICLHFKPELENEFSILSNDYLTSIYKVMFFLVAFLKKPQIYHDVKFKLLIFNLEFCNYIHDWGMFVLHIIFNWAGAILARFS